MCFRERSYDLSDPLQGIWMSRTLDEMLGVPSYGLKSRSAGESTILDVSRFRNRTEFRQLRPWTLNRELGGREISSNKLGRDKMLKIKKSLYSIVNEIVAMLLRTWYPLSSSSFRFINFSFCSEKLTNWSNAFLFTWLYFFSSSLHWCSFFHN